MGEKKNDILQGTLVLLVLRTLASSKKMHGYAITARIHQVSEELLRVEEGSLYPALHRLEAQGWISATWKTSENNRQAKYYTLTAEGRRQLAEEKANWIRLSAAVANIVGA